MVFPPARRLASCGAAAVAFDHPHRPDDSRYLEGDGHPAFDVSAGLINLSVAERGCSRRHRRRMADL